MVRNPIILNTIAKTLNAGGSAIVSAFDAGAGIFNCTMSALSPGEKTKLRSRIKTFEKKIQSLNGAIVKEASKYQDPASALESESVIAILGNIKELNNAIAMMKQRIVEIDNIKAEKPKAEKPKQAEKKTPNDSGGVANFFIKSISSSIISIMPGEKASLERVIAEHEKKIQTLYLEIAKETSNHPDAAAAIASEAVISIIAKINELKTEIVRLKQCIVEIAEGKKAEKAQAMVKSNKSEVQAESDVPAPVADSITGIANLNDGASVCDSSEPSGVTVIGYSRTKPCLIPNPTPLPLTRVDIETADLGLQPDDTREDRIGRILEEHAAATAVFTSVEELSAPQGADNDAASISAFDELSAEIDTQALENVSNAPVEDAVVSAAEVTPLAEEQEIVPQAAFENVPAGIYEEPETSATAEAAASNEAIVTSLQEDAVSVSIAPVEEQPSATVATDELSDMFEKYNHDEIPLPEDEETKPSAIDEADAEKSGWQNTQTTLDEFSSIRTRSHTTTFTTVPELQPVIPAPDLKPESISSIESGPLFRTRLHLNTFSTIAAGPTEITAEEDVVDPVGEELHSSEADAAQYNIETVIAPPQVLSEEKEVGKRRTSPRNEAVSGGTRKSFPKKRS